MYDYGIDLNSLECRFRRFKTLYKECRKGKAADEFSPGRTNLEELKDQFFQLFESVNFYFDGHDSRLLRRYMRHEKEFYLQLCAALAEQVRQGKGRIGFMSDPNGPYWQIEKITKNHDIYDWSAFGVSPMERRSWSEYDFMDVDFLAAESMLDNLFEEEEIIY